MEDAERADQLGLSGKGNVKMIKIDLPAPMSCDRGYVTINKQENAVFWPCPCYDGETQACQAVVPHRALYDPDERIDELKDERPEWCPLAEE